jgi:hypothetical protein
MIPNYSRLERMLIRDEGRGKRGQMFYFCQAGCLTFGVGRNVDAHEFTKQERIVGRTQGLVAMSDICLLHDAERSYRDVCDLFGWDVVAGWHERRIHAVTNAVFCLGITRFRRFVKTIDYIKRGMWMDASIELCDSDWRRKTPDRPDRLAQEFRLEQDSEYDK